jgi:hypothetical protein
VLFPSLISAISHHLGFHGEIDFGDVPFAVSFILQSIYPGLNAGHSNIRDYQVLFSSLISAINHHLSFHREINIQQRLFTVLHMLMITTALFSLLYILFIY